MPEPETPLWWTVVEGIAADITAGLLRIGAKVPSPPDLTARFNCDRNTIRRAYDHLSDLGVLDPQPGRGTFVAAIPPGDLELPARGRVSPLERRLNARIDELAARLTEHERNHPGGNL